jgi:hypothetical protein
MSSVTELLKEAVLNIDFRSGSFRDWSGNSNDGVPDDVYFTGNGLRINKTAGNIAVNDSPELRLTTGSIVIFTDGGFSGRDASQILLEKRGVGGTNYSFLVGSLGRLGYYDGTVQRNGTIDAIGKNYLACNFTNGQETVVYLDEEKETLIGAVDVIPQTVDLSIGNLFSKTLFYADTGAFVSVLIFPRELTDAEHSILRGYLSNIKWGRKLQTISHANLKINREDPSFVAGWEMKNTSGKLLDVGPNKVDGTIIGNLTTQKTLMGGSLFFNGAGHVDLGNREEFKIDEFTVSCWLKPQDDVSALEMIIGGGAHWYLGVTNPNRIIFSYYDVDPTQITLFSSNNAIKGGVWNHIVQTVIVVGSNVTLKTYVNGVLVNDVTNTNGWRTSYGTDWAIGRFSTSFKLNGNLENLVFHNEEKSESWVQEQYQKGLTALYKGGWGVYESVVDQTEVIENSSFSVQAGSFKVATDDIDEGFIKSFEGTTATNKCGISTPNIRQSSKDAAYGTWKFWVYKKAGNSLGVHIVSDSIETTTASGYRLFLDSTGKANLYRYNAGSVASTLFSTDTDVVPVDQWSLWEIFRKKNDEFTVYLNKQVLSVTSGSNPVVDSTIDSSDYTLLQLGDGDKFGHTGFIKRLVDQ